MLVFVLHALQLLLLLLLPQPLWPSGCTCCPTTKL
jgi:hypothetical protein